MIEIERLFKLVIEIRQIRSQISELLKQPAAPILNKEVYPDDFKLKYSNLSVRHAQLMEEIASTVIKLMPSNEELLSLLHIPSSERADGKDVWDCPVCGQRPMIYGANTCDGPAVCGNEPHVTGKQYLDDNGYRIKQKKSGKSVGIAKISNE